MADLHTDPHPEHPHVHCLQESPRNSLLPLLLPPRLCDSTAQSKAGRTKHRGQLSILRGLRAEGLQAARAALRRSRSQQVPRGLWRDSHPAQLRDYQDDTWSIHQFFKIYTPLHREQGVQAFAFPVEPSTKDLTHKRKERVYLLQKRKGRVCLPPSNIFID